ncbi:MAG TPA: isoprenylcysteine carboxylmethyltransferase family protein [Polyangiales bacterium]|nr:isoprenylcysteine carboxylmethyltransferase family protein [Polyangiales bacterium]
MVTRAYVCLLVCVVIQRLIEVRVSKRNEAALLQQGASEHAPGQMPWMIALHAGWLVSSLLEVWLFERPFRVWLAVLALLVFSAGQVLRLLAIQALDDRWTVKVITLPGAPAISDGIFRYLRHPNYLGVVLEIAALPLVHGAWLTALLFSIANGLLLRARIRAEEQALRETGDYDERFAGRPRFVPRRDKEVHEHA